LSNLNFPDVRKADGRTMHTLDADVLFRLALGKIPPNARLYRATQEGPSMRQNGETI
jgi:hypothetical protein